MEQKQKKDIVNARDGLMIEVLNSVIDSDLPLIKAQTTPERKEIVVQEQIPSHGPSPFSKRLQVPSLVHLDH